MNAKKYKPRLEVLASPEIVAQRTLEYFIAEVKKTLAAKEAFYAALSGGNTPKHFFELLGTQPQSHNLPWDKIHLFWVDERYVPVTSPQSNYKLAADTFLNKVSIPQQNIHRIPTEMADVHAAASKYE